MKIAVTGANGQLGRALFARNSQNPFAVLYSTDCDITDREAVLHTVKDLEPDIVIHCAAYTAVDKAESEPERCESVNVGGTRNIIEAKTVNAAMVLISTDYVFDGLLDRPYEVDDQTAPLSVYGKSKEAAEILVRSELEKHYIVRTSWMFGDGNNFVKTMLRLSTTRDEISVVNDQIGSPSYAEDVAQTILQLLTKNQFGTYHVTNSEFCSWADLADAVFRYKGLKTAVKPVTSHEYGSKAVRPYNSRLSKQKLLDCGIEALPTWRDALTRYLDII